MRALGLAASARSRSCAAQGIAVEEAIVLLDGNYDYITAAPATGLTCTGDQGRPRLRSAAAASVIAKVARDALMVGLHGDLPAYQWAQQGIRERRAPEAIDEHGLAPYHRASWAITRADAVLNHAISIRTCAATGRGSPG